MTVSFKKFFQLMCFNFKINSFCYLIRNVFQSLFLFYSFYVAQVCIVCVYIYTWKRVKTLIILICMSKWPWLLPLKYIYFKPKHYCIRCICYCLCSIHCLKSHGYRPYYTFQSCFPCWVRMSTNGVEERGHLSLPLFYYIINNLRMPYP